MKPCQLCGAKSWGPIDPAITPHQEGRGVYFLVGKDLSQFRRCDGCGSFASIVQMALEDPPRRDPVEDSLGILTPGPANPLTMARDMLQGMMPKPETRLERLVRAMLQNGSVHKDFIGPRDVVGYARTIESELNACPDLLSAAKGAGGLFNPLGVGGGPWLALSWKDQTAYESWIIDLWRLLEHDPQWRMPQFQLDMAVEFATRTRADE